MFATYTYTQVYNDARIEGARVSLVQLANAVPIMVRSGVGTYAGAARRRVHIATVLVRPPSGHRPGRRQARHARILQIGLRLAIVQAEARPVMPISLR